MNINKHSERGAEGQRVEILPNSTESIGTREDTSRLSRHLVDIVSTPVQKNKTVDAPDQMEDTEEVRHLIKK